MSLSFSNKSWLVALVAPFVMLSACKKTSSIAEDNDDVLTKPYNLYVSNSYGLLLNTNDGSSYTTVFPADGYPIKSIATSGENLLIIKDNLHISYNNGKNFEPSYKDIDKSFPWNEQLCDVPAQKRIYTTSKFGRGVAYSENNGKDWVVDTRFATSFPSGIKISSFVAQENGAVYGFSNASLILMWREAADSIWKPVTIEGTFPSDGSEYFLVGGDGKRLALLDNSGDFYHYFSEDNGINWTRIATSSAPRGAKVNTGVCVPNGPILFGLDGAGIFKEEGGALVSASNGLEKNTSVNRLSVKRNYYKNGVYKDYVYAATNKGMFRSVDKGSNWVRLTDTTFQHNYTGMN